MKNKRGLVLMSLGLLLLLGAVFLTGFNILDEQRAQRKSEVTAEAMHGLIPDFSGEEPAEEETLPEATVMQTVEIDGGEYIGVLDIPALELSLPVQKDWSYPKLKLSPCRYAGSFLEDNMVIAAHNYRKFFGMLSQLQAGDILTFTDVLGTVYQYEVVLTETLNGTAVEEMISEDWALTLFTCTPSGQSRVTVRCRRVIPDPDGS